MYLGFTLALLVGQVLAPPPPIVPFGGEQVSVQVAAHQALRLGPELFDLAFGAGWHRLTEPKATQVPGPLLLIRSSRIDAMDGDAVVVGHGGLRVKGPAIYSVFSVEPFPQRFLPLRLRMLFEGGASIFSAQAAEFLLVQDDARWVRVIGLDPTARYEVQVGGKRGVEQVLVAVDLEVPPERDTLLADAAWSASRHVLRGGGKAALPATRQIAFTLLGVPALLARPVATPVEVTVRLVKRGTGALGPTRTVVVGQSLEELLALARRLLEVGQWNAALTLTQQCLQAHPENAECHLLAARGAALGGDLPTAVREGCIAVRLGAGTAVAEETREMLGVHAAKCR